MILKPVGNSIKCIRQNRSQSLPKPATTNAKNLFVNAAGHDSAK